MNTWSQTFGHFHHPDRTSVISTIESAVYLETGGCSPLDRKTLEKAGKLGLIRVIATDADGYLLRIER